MRALLDTNMLIDGVLDAPGFEVAVASLSYAELRFGIACAASDDVRVIRAARLDLLQARLGPGLPFDDAASVSYGHVTALVRARGGDPRSNAIDLMIASVAHANAAAVITRNVRDFARLEGLVHVIAG